MTIPPLNPIYEDGIASCGWCDTPDMGTPCGAAATWHIAWTIDPDDADCSLACESHAAAARRLFTIADEHRVDADCSMPGVQWLNTDPSRCGLSVLHPGESNGDTA